MTGWIIFLSILAVILFILFMPAVVDFRYEQNKTNVRISYCGFGIFDTSKEKKKKTPEEIEKAKKKKELKKKKKEEKKAAKEAKKAEKAAKSGKKTETKTKEKRSVKDILELVKSLLAPVKKGMRRLFKGIRITRLYLDIKVGAFDACECAIAYGKICTIVSNALAFLQSFFVIKADHIDIQPRFSTEKTVYTVRFRAKISPAAVLAAGFSLAWTYLMGMMKSSGKDETNNRTCTTKKEEIKNAE
ncbi:MAG: DUF2953 domain-containing protein [Ruminococcus sp.]